MFPAAAVLNLIMRPSHSGPLLALLVLALLGGGLWHLHVLNRWMAGRSDLIAPWVAGTAAFQGSDPYAASTTAEIQRRYYGHSLLNDVEQDKQAFVYPLYTVLIIAPLAWFTWPHAQIVFISIGLPAIGVLTFLWLRILGIATSRPQTILFTAFALVSWPVLVALRQQQLTLLLLWLITLGCFALFHNRPEVAGFFFGLAVFKPQLAAVTLLWLFLRCAIRRQWRFPFSFLLTMTLALIASERLRRGWFQEWLAAVTAYRRYTHSLPSLEIYFGPLCGSVLLLGVLAISVVALWRLVRSRATESLGLGLSLTMALTTALIPTNLHWIYNQVLLLPGCLFLYEMDPVPNMARKTRSWALVFLFISFITAPISAVAETLTAPSVFWDFLPYANLFLPSLIAIALATTVVTHTAPSSNGVNLGGFMAPQLRSTLAPLASRTLPWL